MTVEKTAPLANDETTRRRVDEETQVAERARATEVDLKNLLRLSKLQH